MPSDVLRSEITDFIFQKPASADKKRSDKMNGKEFTIELKYKDK